MTGHEEIRPAEEWWPLETRWPKLAHPADVWSDRYPEWQHYLEEAQDLPLSRRACSTWDCLVTRHERGEKITRDELEGAVAISRDSGLPIPAKITELVLHRFFDTPKIFKSKGNHPDQWALSESEAILCYIGLQDDIKHPDRIDPAMGQEYIQSMQERHKESKKKPHPTTAEQQAAEIMAEVYSYGTRYPLNAEGFRKLIKGKVKKFRQKNRE